jgi:hypothetical protein
LQPLFRRYSPRRVAAVASRAIESTLSESGEALTTPYKNMVRRLERDEAT